MMPGMIMLWYGSVESIPTGWNLCDGSMGTPDLRDRFVVAAGGSFGPGDTGGAYGHLHTFVGDGHSHDLASGEEIIDSSPAGEIAHATTISPATGDTGIANHLPPYHALCYIMKL